MNTMTIHPVAAPAHPMAKLVDGPAGVAANAVNLATACAFCSHNCGLRVDVKDNRIVEVRGDESHPATRGYTCNKGYAIPHYVHHRQRVEHPLKKRADGSFERISWDQAISEIAARLNQIRSEHAPRAIGLAGIGGQGNHSGGLGSLALMASIGSPTLFNALAQEKTQNALVDRRLFKTAADSFMGADTERSDYAVIMGSNVMISNRGANATDVIKELAADPARKLVVIDPRITETSRRADRHLRVKPARDVYLLLALAGIIAQENLFKPEFLRKKTRGHTETLGLLLQVDVARMAEHCGVPLQDLQATAREFAAAKAASIHVDLGVEHGPHSTIIAYLMRVILLLTDNIGHYGGNVFAQVFGPRMPYVTSWAKALVSGIEAIPLMVPLGVFSPNLLPEEILNDHPERIRALIVDGANPLASYADTHRQREALRQLDLLVVVEPAMSETAREADYVLPTPTGYEKWELALFPREHILFQLRPPVVNGPAEALPEVEIYFRLARAMGLNAPAPKMLHSLARKARTGLGAPAYLSALMTLSASRGGGLLPTIGRAAFWAYETLGPTLPNPMLSLVWLLSQGYGLTLRDQVERALPGAKKLRNPFKVGELVFSQILAHPEGVVVGHLDVENNFAINCRYRDGKARLYQEDFARDIQQLLQQDVEAADLEYPFVLDSGMRTGWSANTIIRDPAWRKGKGPHAALLVSSQDAEILGLETGAMVRLSSRRGSVDVPVRIDAGTLPGHLHLPNIFDLKFPDAESGELRSTGVGINTLTDTHIRDPYTGCPHLKHVRCRIEILPAA